GNGEILWQLRTAPAAAGSAAADHRRAERAGPHPPGATGLAAQGLLDLLEAPLLGYRQAAQTRPASRTGETQDWRPARPPQAPASPFQPQADQRRLLRVCPGLLP